MARPAYLRKRRNMVRPITRARRWTSMLLDLTAWLVVWGFGFTVFAIGFSFAVRDQTTDLTEFQQTLLMWSVPSIGVLAGLLSVVWPALTPHGASLGQRIVSQGLTQVIPGLERLGLVQRSDCKPRVDQHPVRDARFRSENRADGQPVAL